MSCSDDESAAIEELARQRWGPTGWRCPRCACTRAWRLRTRPRVRECAGCGLQRSVTGGTLLHRCRLPLRPMLDSLVLDSPKFASVRQTRALLGCALSSAWHAVQRRLKAWSGVFDPASVPGGPVHRQQLPAVVSRGRIADPAPLEVRRLREQQHRVWVHVGVEAVGDLVRTQRISVSPYEQRERRTLGRYEHPVIGLDRWLASALRWERTASVRWFPRWLGTFLTQWIVYCCPGREVPRGFWIERVTAVGAHPLRRLDPWWEPVSPPS